MKCMRLLQREKKKEYFLELAYVASRDTHALLSSECIWREKRKNLSSTYLQISNLEFFHCGKNRRLELSLISPLKLAGKRLQYCVDGGMHAMSQCNNQQPHMHTGSTTTVMDRTTNVEHTLPVLCLSYRFAWGWFASILFPSASHFPSLADPDWWGHDHIPSPEQNRNRHFSFRLSRSAR